MQSRTQYLIFLSIWAGALIIIFIILMAYGFSINEDVRAPLLLSGVLALVPASVGYILVRKFGTLVDLWRVKQGHDVYREREFEDDSGFIHLNEVSTCERQEELDVGEIVSGMKPMLDHVIRDSDDPK